MVQVVETPGAIFPWADKNRIILGCNDPAWRKRLAHWLSLVRTQDAQQWRQSTIAEVRGRECKIGSPGGTRCRPQQTILGVAVLRVSSRNNPREFWVHIKWCSSAKLSHYPTELQRPSFQLEISSHWTVLFASRLSSNTEIRSIPDDIYSIFTTTSPTLFCFLTHFIQDDEHRDSASSRIGRSAMLPICATVFRVWHPA